MPIKISNDRVGLEIAGTIIATAVVYNQSWWIVAGWPWLFRRNQAITALAVSDLLRNGHAGNDSLVVALRSELLS
jgi:hypothetical protein